ncbi:MAG: ion channel [Bacteroidota bacterium]
MAIFKNRPEDLKEFGFGTKVYESNQRLITKGGRSNVKRKGLSFLDELSFFHSLITMPWWKFNLLVASAYLSVNLIFALLYYFIDIANINGMIAANNFERFMEAFFFSTQSLTTVGYGRLNPVGLVDSTIAAFESMMGLLGFALATGLLYGRFSRPVVKMLFSDIAVIAPYRDMQGFMIRLANKRKHDLIEVEAQMIYSWVVIENGKEVRKFDNLNLEIKRISVLSATWTLVHPIDDNSPMKDNSVNDFKTRNVEIVVNIKAFDESFSQTVYSRTSYKYNEIISGAKFVPAISPNPDGSILVELDKISAFEKIAITSI